LLQEFSRYKQTTVRKINPNTFESKTIYKIYGRMSSAFMNKKKEMFVKK